MAELTIVRDIISMFSIILAPHYSSCAALRVLKAFQIVSAIIGVFDCVVPRSLHSFVRKQVTALWLSPLLNHAVYWLINPLVIPINSSIQRNQRILPPMQSEQVRILSRTSLIQVPNNRLAILQNPAFKKPRLLARQMVDKHSSITGPGHDHVTSINAQLPLEMLD